ncbi:DMT family transporter [Patescibacteria group bacterium]|nr:DMT family transporter [Patescibacteria group bacterium]
MAKRSKKKQTRLQSYLFLGLNTLVWGAALIIVKPALSVTTPFRYLFYRFAFAGLLSLPILFHYWPKIKNKKKTITRITLLELIGTTLSLGLLYFGLSKTSAIEASFITTTTPIFVVLAGILYLKEKEEKHELFGLTLAFIGTVLLTALPVILNGNSLDGLSLDGNLLIIGQNIAVAIYYVLAKKHYKKLPKLFVASISFYVGITTFFFLSLLELNFSFPNFITAITNDFSSTSVWFATLYMAIFGSIIGLTSYIKGQDGIEASEAGLFTYLQPLIYVPLGIILLKEHVYPLQIVSLIIIFAGVYLAESRFKKKKH